MNTRVFWVLVSYKTVWPLPSSKVPSKIDKVQDAKIPMGCIVFHLIGAYTDKASIQANQYPFSSNFAPPRDKRCQDF